MHLFRPAIGVAALVLSASAGAAEPQLPLWRDAPDGLAELRQEAPELDGLKRGRFVRLDTRARFQPAQAAPGQGAEAGPLLFSVPLPDGSDERFRLEESSVLAPALAARYPGIRTYKGVGVDTPEAWGRFEWSEHGFHGYVQVRGETVYVNPVDAATGRYVSFYRKDLERPTEAFFREHATDEIRLPQAPERLSAQSRGFLPAATTGGDLRTYRLAVGASGEYTAYHGGTKADALGAIATAINRVNGIFEREFAVSLELVANADDVIYTDAGSDPYDNASISSTQLAANQNTLDAVIGSANYDLGHLFTAPGGGGGLATTPSVCNASYKARGMSGRSSPGGDPFWVDIVAHEMGHQLSAGHSFNGVLNSCGPNRYGATAYEPGSGTTIMSYSGSCGADNIAFSSDDYFHAGNFEQIAEYVSLYGGASCGTLTSSGNSAPVVDGGATGLTLPMQTPFELIGSAEDADGDALTFMWEQIDLGDAGSPETPVGSAPLFRSFPATGSPRRAFPQWADILSGVPTIGEHLPDYARDLNFRFTVRDGQGGVGNADVFFQVTDAAGPFAVLAPNAAGLGLTGGAAYDVTWDVAGTDVAPVNCGEVDILLSPDGGNHFSAPLLAATANDGSASVTLPDIVTGNGRIKVQCRDNVFFDVSDNDFTLGALPADALVRDGGLESGSPNAEWTEWSHYNAALNPSVVEDPASARSGNWYVRFGRYLGDHSSITQTGVIPEGSATLEFWLTGYAVGNSAAELRVKVDGVSVFTATEAEANDYAGYTQVSLDLSAYADGGSHTLVIEGEMDLGTYDNSNFTQFLVDDVRLLVGPPQYVLDVTKSGTGSGWVDSTFGGIQCGSDCDETYMEGVVATLTASADGDSTFVGWSGGGCSGTGSCSVTMNGARSVTAEFSTAASGCSAATQTLASGYPDGVHSVSSETAIGTSGTVAVASGATLALQAPVITLSPGFSAAAGSSFSAVAGAVNCGG